MSKLKWSLKIDFETLPDGGGEMVLYGKTSKTDHQWKEFGRAVVPEGVELKAYAAFCEAAHFAMGDGETFWQDVFQRDVGAIYSRIQPTTEEAKEES